VKEIFNCPERIESISKNFGIERNENEQCWSIVQEKALEKALRKFRFLQNNKRWKKIAEIVKDKTQKECKDKFNLFRQKLMVQNKFLK